MALRGVNRVIIAVEDLDESVAFYSELLGAVFEDISWTGEAYGIRVAVSWDAGIELCAPMPGRQEDSIMSPFLAEHGEGVVIVVFGVDDADEARARAERAGVESLLPVDYSQEQIDQHLGGHFRTYKEYFLNSASKCGCILTLAQIDAK